MNLFHFGTTSSWGNVQAKRTSKFNNLDKVISVDYRASSNRATHIHRWTTNVLRDYIVKGFTLDDARLKRGGSSYWKELLDLIRDIRRLITRSVTRPKGDLWIAC